MTAEEAIAYKECYEIVSPGTWCEEKQTWVYDQIDDKTKVSGEAQALRVSRKVMEDLLRWFPDRDDVYSNELRYTAREMNRCIRAAIAQNYKKMQQHP